MTLTRDQLIENYMPLARKMANKVAQRCNIRRDHSVYDDILSDAYMALIQAVDCYDESKGACLYTWLMIKIRQKMLDAWLARIGRGKFPKEAQLIYIDEVFYRLEDHGKEATDSLIEDIHVREAKHYLEQRVDEIYGAHDRVKADLFKLHVIDGLSVTIAGERLGLSKANASQHLIKVKARMGREARRAGVL